MRGWHGRTSYLGKPGADEKVSEAAMRLFRSGARMQRLLDDLVEFNRSNLGLGIPVDSKSAAGLI